MIFTGNHGFATIIPQRHAVPAISMSLCDSSTSVSWVPFSPSIKTQRLRPPDVAPIKRSRWRQDWSASAKFIDLAAEMLNRCWRCRRLLGDVAGEIRPCKVVQHFFCFLRLIRGEMSNRQIECFSLSLSHSASIMLNFSKQEPNAVANRVLGCFHG